MGQVSTFAHFGPLTPRDRHRLGGVYARGARRLEGLSEPLSDPDQLLSIAKHGPNVNTKQVVGVCNTQ